MRVLLLSIDFEDWHQLVRRRVGVQDWSSTTPALKRQMEALLGLLEELGLRGTFFVLGVTARTYPALVESIAERGHEIACHGDQHLPVRAQTQIAFAEDLRAARRTIERLTGAAPVGYRAPAFSLPRGERWPFETLAAEGFAYDSSLQRSPGIRGGDAALAAGPYALHLHGGRTIWELPPAACSLGRVCLPVGGASYWTLMPTWCVVRGLAAAGEMGGIYLHPHELDPEPLRAGLPPRTPVAQRCQARLRAEQRNAARRRAPAVLRALADRYRLITYGEAHAELSSGIHPRA